MSGTDNLSFFFKYFFGLFDRTAEDLDRKQDVTRSKGTQAGIRTQVPVTL